MSIDPATGLRFVEVIASVGVGVSSLELLARPRLVDDASLMSWPVFRLRHPWFATGASGAAIGRVLGFPRILGVVALRLAAALLLIAVPTAGPVHVLLLGLVALGTSMLILRTTFGLDGADQLVLITFTTLALVAVNPSATAARLGLWFIALQACLAYFTAGIYKVTSRTWWDGSALTGVLGTLSYGNRSLAEVVEPRYDELFTLVQAELRRSGYEDMVPAGVVLTGGTSKMEGVVELAEEIFHMPVRVGYPQSVRGLNDIVRNPIYATSVGLLQYGLLHRPDGGAGSSAKSGGTSDGVLSRAKAWLQSNF